MPDAAAAKPLVLLPTCQIDLHGEGVHYAGQAYTRALSRVGLTPLLVTGVDEGSVDELLSRADGLLLTGSPSNVDPARYGQAVAHPKLSSLLDPGRDAWTLPAVRHALAQGLPILGICRGLQEANVALGGSLHQAVHRTGRHLDHRPPSRTPGEPQYAHAHALTVQPGGMLAQWLDPAIAWPVNSLHGQGIDRLAPGALVEAVAPDGLVEAFSVSGTRGFNLFVQWHPEWYSTEDPVSAALFGGFAKACAQHARQAAN